MNVERNEISGISKNPETRFYFPSRIQEQVQAPVFHIKGEVQWLRQRRRREKREGSALFLWLRKRKRESQQRKSQLLCIL
jgi:hypothetical protein